MSLRQELLAQVPGRRSGIGATWLNVGSSSEASKARVTSSISLTKQPLIHGDQSSGKLIVAEAAGNLFAATLAHLAA